jgi:hypothetical protein
MPRFLVPDKDSMLYINNYAYLSPLGGFNGYAQGLIYFGLFFADFLFYYRGLCEFPIQESKEQRMVARHLYLFFCMFLISHYYAGWAISFPPRE